MCAIERCAALCVCTVSVLCVLCGVWVCGCVLCTVWGVRCVCTVWGVCCGMCGVCVGCGLCDAVSAGG